MRFLILLLFLSCNDPIEPRVFTTKENCLSRTNSIKMQYCLDRLIKNKTPPYSNKSNTKKITTKIKLKIINKHLIKKIFK